MTDLPDPDGVRDVYDRKAPGFHRARLGSRMEAGWIARFAGALPGPQVLDLGCGTGEPVARMLLGHGLTVTGADFSPGMLAVAAQHLPGVDWIEADMRALDLGRQFDGIVVWHSIFHLTATAQREALPRIAAHLKPGGVLLMTIGAEAGEEIGHVEGDLVYHASLSQQEYRDTLDRCGIEVTEFVVDDMTCGEATVLMARRRT